MHFSTILGALTLASGLVTASPLLEARETCSTPSGSGTCQSTSSCGGFSVSGYCSGGTSNQCCITKSCSTSSGSGTCLNTSKGCSGGSFVAGACPGTTSVQCCVKGGGGGGGDTGGNLPGLDARQSSHARAIMGVAKQRGLGRQGCLAGIATAVVESSILVYANNAVPASLNYPHDAVGSDHDSIGIFQQRASIYTNVAASMDPAGSAGQFYTEMVKISGWQTLDVGTLCQRVQRSAFPDRYNDKGLPVATPVCNAGGF